MIKEAYVSFEAAKLLKEKGFDEICNYEWGIPDIDGDYVLQKWALYDGQIKNSELIDGAYAAPTHQMAMAWLREKHNIHIEFIIFWMLRIYYSVDIVNFQIGKEIKRIKTLPNFDSYEEAVEAAIKYSLENLI